jgi:hypothetical protein
MTSYIVQDRVEVSLAINGVAFPLDAVNLLNFLHIGYWTRGIMPTVHLSVFDARHTLDTVQLQDGIPLTITVKALGSTTTTYNFRKFHHRKTFNGNGFIYEMDGYLNYAKYWAGTSVGGLQGTSSEVLSQIASTCGLTFDGVATNDSQIWLPRNRTYGEFASKIKARGWIADSSYMELAVNPDGSMRYYDVNNLAAPTQKIVLGQYLQGSYTVVDYTPKAKSGITNKMTGYQNTRYAQSAISSTPSVASSTITFVPDSSAPLFNTTVQQQVARGYQTFGGIDVGNTHANYEQAIYQNMRFANTYSMDVEFLIQTPTTFKLLDTFTFAVDQEANKQDQAFAGTYAIAGKAILITGATYAEKLLGVRQGVNSPYTSG